MEADRQAIRQFIQRVHGPEPSGWLILWTRQDKATRSFHLGYEGEFDRAVEYCAVKASTFDVYAAVGLQHDKPANGSRGAEPGVSVLPGLWADIDIAGAAHKSDALPPTEGDARGLVDTAGLEPSLLVHSGFGLQPYWLFREPFHIENDAERKKLKSLSTRFQLNLRLHANLRNWTMDSTADLCRVLRIPGTLNHKIGGDVRMVAAEYGDQAYNLDDFEDLLAGVEDPRDEQRSTQRRLDLPPAKMPPILSGCAWMRHCRDDAASLAEPEWYRMLTIVARCQDAERWAHDLSRAYPKYTLRETRQKLKHAASDNVAPATCAYVESDLDGGRFCRECLFRGNINSPIAIGRIEGVEIGSERETPSDPAPTAESEQPVTQPTPIETAATKAEKFTDLGNARRFVARYRGTVLYCEAWNHWLLWDNMRWAEDDRLEIFARAADLIRGLYATANRIADEDKRKVFLNHLMKSESHRGIQAIVAIAKSDRSIARQADNFDRDHWLCAVKNGTLDLQTGDLRPSNQKDMITKLAPVTYDPSARCPNWLAFLEMIMLGRKSLVGFLKRALGSSLTGITSDKAMFILYGPGGDNGKSTLIETVELLLGDYARRTPIETFLRKREGSIPNDIARLRGTRFVWAAENDRGVRLAESVIKEMTGGDRMAARFLHGEFFEFMPAFKIWLATNHKPTIRGDAAIWRRLQLVPFDYTIPKDQQRKRHEVMAMFQAELPGILNWAIEGCLEWQREGLGVPEEVVNATREYEAEQDTFSMFLEEKCVRAASASVLSLALYREYKGWAEEHGETPASHKTFASLMSERGIAKSKTMRGVQYSGIGLRTEDHYDTERPRKDTPAQPPVGQDHGTDGNVV